MTELTQVRRKNTAVTIAGVALAASLLGGIVGNRVEAFVQSVIDAQAANAARAAAAEQAKWDAYSSDWERRYRQQSTNQAVNAPVVLEAAKAWEVRHRQMYPAAR